MEKPWQPVPNSHSDPLLTVLPVLAAAVTPIVVGVSLRGWKRPEPHVQVHQIDGQQDGVNELSVYQVDVRHNSYGEGQLLCYVLRPLLRALPGTGKIRGVDELHGPEWVVDIDDLPRFRMEWAITVGPQ